MQANDVGEILQKVEGVNLKSVIAKRNVAIDIDAFDKPLGLFRKRSILLLARCMRKIRQSGIRIR